MLLQKHLDLAIRAHDGTSMVPETRGAQYIKDYSQQLEEDLQRVEKLGGDTTYYQQEYESLFVSWMSAKSRCISSMITGPSNFPVRRAEKANQSEHNRYQEFSGWREKFFARLEKAKRREARSASDPIAEMRAKLENAEKLQVLMVAANKVVRDKKRSNSTKIADLINLGISERAATELLTPDWCNRIGFASYQLQNNLANIKRMRERLAELEAKASAESQELERPDGIRIVKNTDADRLQIFFPGKPDAATITALKKNAFKWSPSNGCWQRQLTGNALYALKMVLPT
ncbi:MAG: hypothetical protein LCH81_03535 [Bacteroidetes bacterium]|nr:hypothetical protein [Bacteroidota bacterium]